MADVPPLEPTPPAAPPAAPAETLPALQLRTTANARSTLDAWEDFILGARRRVAALLPSLRDSIRSTASLVDALGDATPPETRAALAGMRENLRRAVELAGPEA